MYILTLQARQKRARRHIHDRYKTIEEARVAALSFGDRYIFDIFSGNWKHLEHIDKRADEFKPLTRDEVLAFAKERGNKTAAFVLLLAGVEYYDGTFEEFNDLINELEKETSK